MKIRTTCLLLGAALLAGCWQKSVHPFYTAADVAYDAKLLGTWQEDKESKDGQIWMFTEGPDKGYKLTITDGSETNLYEAHLFKLDGHRLLDIIPTQRTVSMIPAHNLFSIPELGPSLQLAMLNIEWVQDWLRKNPNSLSRIAIPDPENRDDREKDELVITADTKAVQEFLHDHWKEPELFSKPGTLKLQGK